MHNNTKVSSSSMLRYGYDDHMASSDIFCKLIWLVCIFYSILSKNGSLLEAVKLISQNRDVKNRNYFQCIQVQCIVGIHTVCYVVYCILANVFEYCA